jgi:hypothetical protein
MRGRSSLLSLIRCPFFFNTLVVPENFKGQVKNYGWLTAKDGSQEQNRWSTEETGGQGARLKVQGARLKVKSVHSTISTSEHGQWRDFIPARGNAMTLNN